ncbi:hypothetical protein ACFE04_026457 [Oxalis oulophora]
MMMSMWTALRSRSLSYFKQQSSSSFNFNRLSSSFTTTTDKSSSFDELLSLQEVEKILNDVRADDVKVIPIQNDWTDFMVIATGRSTWHVRNIAQALIYKVKQKQKGANRLILPSMEGQESGKWIVVDSGKVIVHALDEKARAYYNLENLWSSNTKLKEPSENPLQGSSQSFLKGSPKEQLQETTTATATATTTTSTRLILTVQLHRNRASIFCGNPWKRKRLQNLHKHKEEVCSVPIILALSDLRRRKSRYQRFTLPEPVLSTGGLLQIELLGRGQIPREAIEEEEDIKEQRESNWSIIGLSDREFAELEARLARCD